MLLLSLPLALFMSSCNSAIPKTETKTTNNQSSDTMKTNNEIIVDVRTPEEWEYDGHANCSVNYPLDELSGKIEELKKYDHIVLVCRSGGRASVAQRQLESAGIKNVENKGAWQNVTCKN